MKKTILAILLVFVMVFSFAACGEDVADDGQIAAGDTSAEVNDYDIILAYGNSMENLSAAMHDWAGWVQDGTMTEDEYVAKLEEAGTAAAAMYEEITSNVWTVEELAAASQYLADACYYLANGIADMYNGSVNQDMATLEEGGNKLAQYNDNMSLLLDELEGYQGE